MIPYQVDPTLHAHRPVPESLDDGFSRSMATTHPSEPQSPDDEPADGGDPNPTRLPVQPEFGPLVPASEPEDPTVHKPTI